MYEKLSEKKSHGTSQLVEILFEGAILFLILIDHQFSEIVWKSAKLEHYARTTDTQWSHKSNISEKLGRCGRQNMLRPYLRIWEWEWILGRAVKAISSLGVRSPWSGQGRSGENSRSRPASSWAKGQLISEWIFSVEDFPKIQQRL